MTIPRLVAPALVALLAFSPLAAAQPESSAPAQPEPKQDPAPPAPAPKKPDAPKPALPPAPKPVADTTLKVGDKAPALKPETWVKPADPAAAPPPASLETGKVYVLEFWATWCPTCRDAMPALAKLARDHKDLTLIAIASSERKPKAGAPDGRLDAVRAFVKEHDQTMPYDVLFDGARNMASAYLVPAGRVYIPTAFVIDATNTITFIGDPHEAGFTTAVTKALAAIAPPPPPKPTTPDPKKPVKPRPKG